MLNVAAEGEMVVSDELQDMNVDALIKATVSINATTLDLNMVERNELCGE